MAVFFSDTFDEASATAITAHTPNVGGAYTHPSISGGTGGTVGAGTGRVTFPAGAAYAVENAATPGAADYTVTGSLQWEGSDGRMDGLARLTGGNSGYMFFAKFDGSIAIYRYDSGTLNGPLVSGTHTGTNGFTEYNFSYSVTGSALSFTFNGTTVNTTDTTYSAAGKVGFAGREASYYGISANDSSTDTTPPTLTSPTGAGGTGTCTGSVSTNEGNGTLYTSFTASATPPSAVQAEAGQDHTGAAALRAVSQSVSASGTINVASGAISAGTRYAHFMHKDAAGNRSTVATSSSFTVTSTGDTTPPTLTSPAGAGGSLVCSGSVSTNEGNGVLYTVFTASATPPSAAQVKNGQTNTGVAALRAVSQSVVSTGVQSVATGSITEGTRYAHFMHEDAALNQSAVASSSAFSVTAASAATLTLTGFKTWTGVPYSSVAVNWVKVFRVSTGALTLELSGQTINAAGTMTISSASLEAAADYMVFGFNADGSLSFKTKATAA